MILPHRTLPSFWIKFDQLPEDVQRMAEAAYEEWINNPRSGGVRFKHIKGSYYSARINQNWRAVCRIQDGEYRWFWIGLHSDYERLLKSL